MIANFLFTLLSEAMLCIQYSKIASYSFIPSLLWSTSPPMSFYYNLHTLLYSTVFIHSFNMYKPPFLMLINNKRSLNSSEDFLSCSVTLHIHCTIMSFISSFAKSSSLIVQVSLPQCITPDTFPEKFTFCGQ